MLSLLACATVLHSLHVDHAATRALIFRYGIHYESNPIIRLVGSDPYFGALYLASAIPCAAELRGERWPAALSVAVWLVQTYYVGTHVRTGTVSAGPPLLFFRIRW